MRQTSSREHVRAVEANTFQDLVATARHLQGPTGCPWDQAQTISSLLPHLIEEVWEVYCAAARRDMAHLEEELGDVLYTVIFLSLLAERDGQFTLGGLLTKTRRKMIRRHPHVFAAARARSADEAYAHWQRAKRRESTRRVSTSKRLRPLIVNLWEALRTSRQARTRLTRLLSELDRLSELPRRPNAKQAPRSIR